MRMDVRYVERTLLLSGPKARHVLLGYVEEILSFRMYKNLKDVNVTTVF